MKRKLIILCVYFFTALLGISIVQARDLAEIKQRGVLRHLGVPYANFVTGGGGGLDVEMMQLFAQDIGVRYQYVKTDWKNSLADLVGKKIRVDGENVIFENDVPVRGDIIANGLTILPWRQKVVDYSAPTFISQVWLITYSSSLIRPIVPTGVVDEDIVKTKKLLIGKTVLGKANTCLDPHLYFLNDVNAVTQYFEGRLNGLAPAIIQGIADTTLLDVPDALVALAKWPGQIKVLGPISPKQKMGVGFRKDSIELQEAFSIFFNKILENGRYEELVKKYYPDFFDFNPEFLSNKE